MSEITLPSRKRRRAALSCVECRRRKIKCDRRLPCTHCVQVKFPRCIYPETHSVLNRRTVAKTISTSNSVHDHAEHPPISPPTSLISSVHSPVSDWSPRNVSTLETDTISERDSLGSVFASISNDSSYEPNSQTLVSRGKPLEPFSTTSASNNDLTDKAISVLGVNLSSYGDIMLQIGGNHSEPSAQFGGNTSPGIQRKKLNPERSHFFGRSHWMNTFTTFSQKCRYKDQNGNLLTGIESQEVQEILRDCRRLIKVSKTRRLLFNVATNFKDQMPPREVADKLIYLYFRTHESTYRILHIPSFKKEYADYWRNPDSANSTFVVRMLLVMAIGTCFYQGLGENELRSQARQWVQLAQSWAAVPVDGRQLSIPWIQVYCLILLTQQINYLRVNLVWISSGNLLQMAFSMGLHRDPKHFPKLSPFLVEIRRRIWATVLEIVVQTSIDVGMPALITSNDFDTEPPSNIDDWDMTPNMPTLPEPQPNNTYTGASFQIILARSLRTRLEIVHFINGFHLEISYDEALRYTREITKACNEASRLINSYSANLTPPTALQINLVDNFVRRFLLEVHRPFFLQSQIDPRYYFSKKICIETALTIFSYPSTRDLPIEHGLLGVDHYERLKMMGEGLIKPILFHAITFVVVELMFQLEEDNASGLPPSTHIKSSREPLYNAIKDMVKLTIDRVKMGENNAVGPVILSAAAALIDAITEGLPPEDVVPEAAKKTAKECLEILKERLKPVPGEFEGYGQSSAQDREVSGGFDSELDKPMQGGEMNFGMEEDWDFGMQDSWLSTDFDDN